MVHSGKANRLGQEHYEVLLQVGRRVHRLLKPGEAASRDADVVTMTSWTAVCKAVWGKRTGATDREARRLWAAGRRLVTEALALEVEPQPERLAHSIASQ